MRGVEGGEHPVRFGVRHAELAELVRQRRDVGGGYRAEAAVVLGLFAVIGTAAVAKRAFGRRDAE
jgi:hypothetical protein